MFRAYTCCSMFVTRSLYILLTFMTECSVDLHPDPLIFNPHMVLPMPTAAGSKHNQPAISYKRRRVIIPSAVPLSLDGPGLRRTHAASSSPFAGSACTHDTAGIGGEHPITGVNRCCVTHVVVHQDNWAIDIVPTLPQLRSRARFE